jgi:enoyl-CoA hydratase/carnithine racemase
LSSSDDSAGGRLLIDEPAPGVARLTISNPGKRGALDHPILDGFTSTLPSLDARCVIITGEEHTFSAGYDIGDLRDGSFQTEAERLVAHPFTAALRAVEAYPFPTLAALNGHTIGGGLELALSCDIRIASRGIKLGMPPAKLGLIYSHTGLRKFIEVCGLANTCELFYVGRNVDAERAARMGLVNQVVERDELERVALSIAGEIASNAPISLEGNKRVLRELRAHDMVLPSELEEELVRLRESCFTTEDFREGVRAFAEKRAPRWQGR